MLGIKVIVETVFDGGTDTEFGAGEEILHGFGKKMGAAVTEYGFTFFIVPGEDLQSNVVVKNGAEVHYFAINFACEGVLCQFVADAVCHFKNGYIVFKTAAVAVRECNCYTHCHYLRNKIKKDTSP